MWKIRFKNIWAERRVRIASVAGGVVIVLSILSAAVKGLESVSDFFAWAEWVYLRANTPWLGLFVVAALSATLWSGLKRVAAAEATGRDLVAKETEIRAQALDEVKQQIADAIHLPSLIARHFALNGDTATDALQFAHACNRLAEYRAWIRRLRHERMTIGDVNSDMTIYPNTVIRDIQEVGTLLGVPARLTLPNFPRPSPGPEIHPTMHSVRPFAPDSNNEFFSIHEDMCAQMEILLLSFNERINERRANWTRGNEQIRQEMERAIASIR